MKMDANLKIILLYQLIVVISAFKLKEFFDFHNINYFTLFFLFLHLICASLCFLGNKYYKMSTIAFHLLAIITIILPFSKFEINKFLDIKFYIKHFYEISILINIGIIIDLKENFKKKIGENNIYIPLDDFPKSNKNENFLSAEKNNNNLYSEKQVESKQINQINIEIENYKNLLKEKEEKIKKLMKQNKENEKKFLDEIEKYKENEKIYYNILKKDPLLKYFSPTLIGLNNIGATCFMNSTLQCLSQTKKLTSYFLKENKKEEIINNNIALKNKDDLQLCPIYLDLIKNLWDINKTKSSFSPNDFMKNIEKMNPLFKQGQAGDSKDFIIFILERIHTELKKPVKQMSNEQNNIQPLNQYDRNNSYYHFCLDFMKDSSAISDNFYGVNETTNECLNCKNMYAMNNMNTPLCYNYGIFNKFNLLT